MRLHDTLQLAGLGVFMFGRNDWLNVPVQKGARLGFDRNRLAPRALVHAIGPPLSRPHSRKDLIDVVIDTTDDTGPGTDITGRDPYLDMLRPILDGAITVHHGHMSEIEITGPDTARGVWSMEDHIWFPAALGLGQLWGTGWYEEDYRRVAARWKIARMVLRRQRVELDGVQTFPPIGR